MAGRPPGRRAWRHRPRGRGHPSADEGRWHRWQTFAAVWRTLLAVPTLAGVALAAYENDSFLRPWAALVLAAVAFASIPRDFFAYLGAVAFLLVGVVIVALTGYLVYLLALLFLLASPLPLAWLAWRRAAPARAP